ncbi:Dimerisation domain-containing protein [Desulfofustis glycolicus DSM 9705]|uniref:Dimerisation domain-containing protein n=2 Tax=Desulfofustis glycolicus TaxID=51195 RepID=A0A1M5YMN1_9BACT|nr:Dimerisation domain-containing protein [Desulfofustis glycolicus DSM 9705]
MCLKCDFSVLFNNGVKMTEKWDVGSLIGTSSAYWRGCTLQAAVRLGIFTVLGGRSLSARAVAAAIGADVRGTGYLLNALAGMELLSKCGDLYRNSEVAARLLNEDEPGYIGHIILHHHHLVDGWAQLDAAVRSGGPVEQRSYGAETERRSFLLGMFNLASGAAPLVVKAVSLAGRKRLLDLGGGPGTYAIHFCRANPELQAVVFDRPTTESFMKRTVESFGLSHRITFAAGDFNRDFPAGGPFDVAWLSHVLHSNGPEQCAALIRKTREALVPGGLILIHDFVLDDTMDEPEFAALFALNMLINTTHGRTYSRAEIAAMLASAGFSAPHCIDPGTPNQSLVLAATRNENPEE